MIWPVPGIVSQVLFGQKAREKPLPSTIMANPTVFDVLRDRINADAAIPPERKVPVFLKASQLIHERGLTQI